MNTPSTNFQIEDNHIFLHGIPELENRRGILIGEGIAMFFDGDSHEVYIANISTGKLVDVIKFLCEKNSMYIIRES